MTGKSEVVVCNRHGRPIRNPNSYLSSDGKEVFRDREFAKRIRALLEVIPEVVHLDENDRVFQMHLMRATAKDAIIQTAGAADLCSDFLRLTELAKPKMTAEERIETDILQVELLKRLLRNDLLDAYVAAGIAPVPASQPLKSPEPGS